MAKFIEIKNARENNLKGIDVKIPLSQITVVSGPSGSGKSSLVAKTLVAESKRRFLNAMSTKVKFFLSKPTPPQVDSISPVLPVFYLPQTNPVLGTRSNVLDLMGVSHLLQKYFFEFSEKNCPDHGLPLDKTHHEESVEKLVNKLAGDRITVFVERDFFLNHISAEFFPTKTMSSKYEINDFNDSDPFYEFQKFKKNNLSKMLKRLSEIKSCHQFNLFFYAEGEVTPYRLEKSKSCKKCNFSEQDLSFYDLSAYNSIGACSQCRGFGEELVVDDKKIFNTDISIDEGSIGVFKYKKFARYENKFLLEAKKRKVNTKKIIQDIDSETFRDLLFNGQGAFPGVNSIIKSIEKKKYKPSARMLLRRLQKNIKCRKCSGSRLKPKAKAYIVEGKSFQDLLGLSISDIYQYLSKIQMKSDRFSKEILSVLNIACEIGLGHLLMSRKAKTLSSSEYQRLLLLKFLSFNGTGSLFVFDEPTIGMDESQMKAIFKVFKRIVSNDNTIVLVDHSSFMIKKADHFIHIGPAAGERGGEVVYSGKPKVKPIKKVKAKLKTSAGIKNWINIGKSSIYDFSYKPFKVPLGECTLVTGDSGSGKSNRIFKILGNELSKKINDEYLDQSSYKVSNLSSDVILEDLIVIKSDLNRFSSRSTIGSYLDLFTPVRNHFLKQPFVKQQGYSKGHLSFNSELGACSKCGGKGVIIIEMQYLEDINLKCDECDGYRLKKELGRLFDGHMYLKDYYNQPISEIFHHLKLTPKYKRILQYIDILKLDYLSLSRELSTLSGGEKQRVYLLSKLLKLKDNSLILAENLSFGLSETDILKLKELVDSLLSRNCTLVVVDQNTTMAALSTFSLEFSTI